MSKRKNAFKQINILGTQYTLKRKKYKDDKVFQDDNSATGYCCYTEKSIVTCILHTHPNFKHDSKKSIHYMEKYILRHEIVHAFLFESGLLYSSHDTESGWSTDEEVVDWIAYQFPKILEIFKEVDAL